MKKILTILSALLFVMTSWAQTMNVVVGDVTYAVAAAQAGDMVYDNGTTLAIQGKTFNVADISKIYIDATTVVDNTVSVAYNGTQAHVTVSGNIARYVDVSVSGAHVTIDQSSEVDETVGEIEYVLSGSTTNGSFTMGGSYKATVSLNELTLTNPSGAAINITNNKRIQISARQGTVNTLTDGANGTQTGCIYSKGQIQLQGKGTLNVYGKTKHGIKSGDYITVKNLTLNVLSAVNDGISCNEYFLMKSGTVTISGVGDDGIQADLDGTSSTGETVDHDDEDSGNIYLEGGTLTVKVTATKAKGIKAAGDMKISDGTITVTASVHEGIESKGAMSITGGVVSSQSRDDAINSGGDLNISGGYIMAYSTGNDGLDANGNCNIKGGVIYAIGARSPEVAIDANTEKQKKLTITEGTIITISPLESGSTLTQSCYQASSVSANTWYALYNGDKQLMATVKTPSSTSSLGSGMVISTSGTPTLKSGVTVSGGTDCFNGMGKIDATVSGGSTVSTSEYTGSGMGPGGPDGPFGPGGPGRR